MCLSVKPSGIGVPAIASAVRGNMGRLVGAKLRRIFMFATTAACGGGKWLKSDKNASRLRIFSTRLARRKLSRYVVTIAVLHAHL